jgi:nuclear pore complex protein Nup93
MTRVSSFYTLSIDMASNGFSTFGASSSQRHNPVAAPPSNLNTLLLQANSLSRNNNSDLPQLRYGIEEIERLSEGPAGRAKRTRNGDGWGHVLI